MKWMCDDVSYRNRKEVVAAYPNAEKVVRVTGGWMVFETIAEYQVWKNQK